MPDSKIADLAEDTAPALTDLLYKVDSTGSSGSDRKVQVGNLVGAQEIAQTVLGASAASISFTSIPATFESLLLVVSGRADSAFPSDYVQARFNNDSGANYYDQFVLGQGTSPTAFADAAASSVGTGKVPAGTATANRGGQFASIVAGYARTTFQKSVMTLCAYSTDATSTGQQVLISGGLWASTAAINRWDIFASSGNLIAGTIATLYGLVS